MARTPTQPPTGVRRDPPAYPTGERAGEQTGEAPRPERAGEALARPCRRGIRSDKLRPLPREEVLMPSTEPTNVCLVTGVGPGTGAAIVRRFAGGGYRVAMLARDAGRLAALEAEIETATAFPCDVTDTDRLAEVIGAVRQQQHRQACTGDADTLRRP